MYKPEPINTSGIRIPGELLELRELLARDTHERWAQERMAQGWRYGPVRDDAQKLHPCLVPFEELPETEKRFDYITTEETIRLILSLGFRIVRDEDATP